VLVKWREAYGVTGWCTMEVIQGKQVGEGEGCVHRCPYTSRQGWHWAQPEAGLGVFLEGELLERFGQQAKMFSFSF
jgi:hypothetical protein